MKTFLTGRAQTTPINSSAAVSGGTAACMAAMEAAGNITNIEADLDPTTWAPTDPVDRFRLVYAQYSAGEFSVSIADELTIPRASDGFDCPTYGMAYTTTDDGEHDLQVLCVPSELVRVYLVDWQEVHADHFSDLDEMTDSMAESGFEDYIGDCEMYGEQAGIITEEE